MPASVFKDRDPAEEVKDLSDKVEVLRRDRQQNNIKQFLESKDSANNGGIRQYLN